ncbi:hypothetical protein GCM10018781_48320 [Kitasatospora indigofera]|uniref:Uncharacterized protein n=1 Tax=Kitasatospora indigofera TaxID=67307 RepID=A0A919G1U8_9ACTN|nr:hypothetical protein GCM10018781_48320 [Kitasatospora indigofera]
MVLRGMVLRRVVLCGVLLPRVLLRRGVPLLLVLLILRRVRLRRGLRRVLGVRRLVRLRLLGVLRVPGVRAARAEPAVGRLPGLRPPVRRPLRPGVPRPGRLRRAVEQAGYRWQHHRLLHRRHPGRRLLVAEQRAAEAARHPRLRLVLLLPGPLEGTVGGARRPVRRGRRHPGVLLAGAVLDWGHELSLRRIVAPVHRGLLRVTHLVLVTRSRRRRGGVRRQVLLVG